MDLIITVGSFTVVGYGGDGICTESYGAALCPLSTYLMVVITTPSEEWKENFTQTHQSDQVPRSGAEVKTKGRAKNNTKAQMQNSQQLRSGVWKMENTG